MSTFADNPALKLYALVAALLGVHLLLLALWTGTVRVMRKQWTNAEDAKLNKLPLAEQDHPDVQRVKRAHQNALENAIPFLAIGLVYALSGAGKSGAQIYFFTFLGARVLHSIFYLLGLQPFRTLMFAVSVLTTIGMAVQVIRVAM